MSESCPKCGANRTQFDGQTSWECGSYQSLLGGSHIKRPAFKLIESEHCLCRTALAAATKRADEAEAKLRWEELRRSVDASLQSWQVSQSLEAIWYIDAYRRVLNCMDRLAPAWKERTVSNVDNQALVDALVKFQRWSDAGGLDYEEQIQGCRDLIATLRTQIAEAEQERDQYKASANVGAEFFHDIGKILAPEGERKSFTDADVKQWAAEAKTAEQENARLRECLQKCRIELGWLIAQTDASENGSVVSAYEQAKSLLAKPEGAK